MSLSETIKENLKNKLANPFLLTYISVWVIRHWKLLYIVFTFEDGERLDYRLGLINTELSRQHVSVDIVHNLFFTSLALLVTYVFIAISTFFIAIFKDRIIPTFIEVASSERIVELKKYNDKVAQYRELFNDYQELIDIKHTTEKDVIKANEKILELERNKKTITNLIEEAENKNIDLRLSLDKVQKDFDSLENARNPNSFLETNNMLLEFRFRLLDDIRDIKKLALSKQERANTTTVNRILRLLIKENLLIKLADHIIALNRGQVSDNFEPSIFRDTFSYFQEGSIYLFDDIGNAVVKILYNGSTNSILSRLSKLDLDKNKKY